MKIFVTIVSGLVIAGVIGLFNFGSRINTLEAKVPALADSFKASERYQEKKEDRIYKELSAMNVKFDALTIIVIKLGNGKKISQ